MSLGLLSLVSTLVGDETCSLLSCEKIEEQDASVLDPFRIKRSVDAIFVAIEFQVKFGDAAEYLPYCHRVKIRKGLIIPQSPLQETLRRIKINPAERWDLLLLSVASI